MGKKRRTTVRVPCDFQDRVKKIAALNNMTCSNLVCLAIQAKLPEYEGGQYQALKQPDNNMH